MKERDKERVIAIGYDTGTDWTAMNVAGQRLLRWNVRFEEKAGSINYCGALADLREPFLVRCGLSAGIALLDPEQVTCVVVAWVWRQCQDGPKLRLASLVEDEISALAKLTRAARPLLVRGFSFFELVSTDRTGDHKKVRRHTFKTGEHAMTSCELEPS